MNRKSAKSNKRGNRRSSVSRPGVSSKCSIRRPVNSQDAMDLRIVNFFQLIVLLAAIPFVIVSLAVDSYAKKARRRSYYEKEKDRRIELADGRRMKLCEYAGIDEVKEGSDGKFYVIDKVEYARRMRLACDRRRIKRHQTLNRMPSAEELRAQWAKVKDSHEEMLRFGSMLCDLEAYVDNSLRRDKNGDVQGRNPGIKGWLGFNCHDIYRKYKTAMRYKQMAVKARQIIDMDEPYPLAVALGDEIEGIGETKSLDCDVGNGNVGSVVPRDLSREAESSSDKGSVQNETSVGNIAVKGFDGVCKSNAGHVSGCGEVVIAVAGGVSRGAGRCDRRVTPQEVAEWRRKMAELLHSGVDRHKGRASGIALSRHLEAQVLAGLAFVHFVGDDGRGRHFGVDGRLDADMLA